MEEVTSADSPIYRDLMRFKPDGWTANAWAVNAGVSRTVWTDMRRHGNPSRRTLEKLLAAAGSSLAEFEALRIGDAPVLAEGGGSLSDPTQSWRPASPPPLPVIASCPAEPIAVGGMLMEAIALNAAAITDRLARPAVLAADGAAYAFTIPGESMWPRFRQGRRVAVSPGSPVATGDDVAVTIRRHPATGEALVVLGELMDAGRVLLRQFKPDRVYTIDSGCIVAIHKIVGELI
jgi:hypothetical protein